PNHQEYKANSNSDIFPWHKIVCIHSSCQHPVDQEAHQKGQDHSVQDGTKPIDQAFIAHHPPESAFLHSHGTKHGELFSPEHQICRNGIEHICHCDQGDQDDESVRQHADSCHDLTVLFVTLRIIIHASRNAALLHILRQFSVYRSMIRTLDSNIPEPPHQILLTTDIFLICALTRQQ